MPKTPLELGVHLKTEFCSFSDDKCIWNRNSNYLWKISPKKLPLTTINFYYTIYTIIYNKQYTFRSYYIILIFQFKVGYNNRTCDYELFFLNCEAVKVVRVVETLKKIQNS